MAVSLRRSSFEAYFLSFFINPLAKMAGAVRFSSSRETLDTKRTTQHTDRHRHTHTALEAKIWSVVVCFKNKTHTFEWWRECFLLCCLTSSLLPIARWESHSQTYTNSVSHHHHSRTRTDSGSSHSGQMVARTPNGKKNKRRPTRVIYRSKLKTILFKWFFPFYFSNIC